MKLLDPIYGLKASVTQVAFQFVFSASIFTALLKYWLYDFASPIPELVTEVEWVAMELFIGHLVVFVLWTLPRIFKCCNEHLWCVFQKICEVLMVLVYCRTIIAACTVYPQVKAQLQVENPEWMTIEPIENLMMWIQIEIRTFFTVIAAGILFLLLSLIRKPNNIFRDISDEQTEP